MDRKAGLGGVGADSTDGAPNCADVGCKGGGVG